MNRTERVLTLLSRDLSTDELLELGITATDALDVLALLNLELELIRREDVRRSIDDARGADS